MGDVMGGCFETGGGVFDFQQELQSGSPAQRSFAGSAVLVQFSAAPPVQGEVGLVQAVQSLRGAAPAAPREGTNDAAITDEAGWRIDSPTSNNPVYGATGHRGSLGSPGERSIELLDETLPESVPTSEAGRERWLHDHPVTSIAGQVEANVGGEAQVGSRYERRGRVESVPAILHDAPGYAGWTPGSAELEQHFETSALVIAGPDRGTWLGSISWGQHVDTAGRVTAETPRVASRGEPTAAMQGAIDQWNGATTTAGASIDLPGGHSDSGDAP